MSDQAVARLPSSVRRSSPALAPAVFAKRFPVPELRLRQIRPLREPSVASVLTRCEPWLEIAGVAVGLVAFLGALILI